MNDRKPSIIELPPVIAGLCLIGAGVLQAWLKTPRMLPPNWDYAGILSVATGLVIGGSAMVAMRQSATKPDPRETPSALVTGGPFRATRNPMYIGMALILLGIALWRGDAVLLAAPVAFVIIINATRIPREERQMEALFGDAYRLYKKKVRRWI